MRMYNLMALAELGEEVLRALPSKLIYMTSKMLENAYRMLPLVGAIAATNPQAAATIAELGEGLAKRTRASAYTTVSLKDLGIDIEIPIQR